MDNTATAPAHAKSPWRLEGPYRMHIDALQRSIIDIPDSESPAELVEGMNEMEAAWHNADGTEPEHE
jgi:hypothetical protein